MRLSKLVVAIVVSILLVLATPVFAQEVTGSIAGTVTDQSGAVVPGAKVTITDTDKKVEVRSVTTNSSGGYSVPGLPVGHYSLTVEAANFQKSIRTGVVLNVNDKLTVSPQLKVGSPQETVSVEASAEQVNLQSAVATGVVTGTQIRELSLSNRNFLELAFLLPGTSNSGNAAFFPGATAPLGTNVVTIQVNGGRREQNGFMVDGADNVDRGSNLTLLSFPSVDSIAEFRVLRGVYDAESGRTGGAQINAITRSGTSNLHGGVYEFFRNDKLNANSYFNNLNKVKRPVLRYNDFGGTLGGPVWIPKIYEQKNKTFFFVSEEARRIVTYSPTPTNGSVPYAGMVNGQFQHVVCTQYQNVNGVAGPCQAYGTSIPQSAWDPVAAAYVKDVFSKFPLPNAATAANPFNTFATLRGVFNFREDMVKIDHVFSQKLSINGKYLHDGNPTVEPCGLFGGTCVVDNIATTATHSPGKQYHIAGTWTPTPTFIVEAAYHYSYGALLNNEIGAISRKNATDVESALGSKLPFSNAMDRVAGITLTGGSGVGLPSSPYNDFNINQTWRGSVSKVWGSHTLRFGAIYYHYNKHENADLTAAQNSGSFGFDNANKPTAATTFNGSAVCTTAAGNCPLDYEQAYANFLLGQDSSFSQGSIDVTANIFDNQFEYFAQDSWRVKKNLTITYGVRHSFFRQPTDASGDNGTSRLSNFDPTTYSLAKAPCILASGVNDVKVVNGIPTSSTCNPNWTPLNGFIFANPPTFNGFKGTQSPYGSKVGKEFNRAIAPRIGVAWDPFGDSKTSIRAGYGMFYDAGLEYGNTELNVGGNPGFLYNSTYTRSTFSAPTSTTTTGGTQTPITIQARMPVNYKSPYTQQWSLDFQREMGWNTFFDIGYFGNNGIHLPGITDLNQPTPFSWKNCTAATPCFAGPGATGATYAVVIPATGVNSSAVTTQLNALRPYVGYGPSVDFEDIYSSNYHSLQMQLNKRFSGQSMFGIVYTWSHGLTTNPADRSTGGSAVPQAYGALSNNYGPTIADRRHVFTANFVYELPWMRNQNGVLGHIAGGWQFSGILTFQTGLPLTATIANGGCASGTGAGCVDPMGSACFGSTPVGCRVNQIGDPNGNAPHTYTQWFNASAFSVPTATQTFIPSERPGAIRGPGFWNTDLSVFKNAKFTERLTGQLRLEMFNALNHTNPICCGSTSYSSTVFNQITSTRDPRIIQLAAKLNF